VAVSKTDVVVIGAGAAGLTALSELHRQGVEAQCLEARDRIGGRILTLHNPFSPIPIELGAEFIHGRSPEIWNLLEASALPSFDCKQEAVHIKDGEVQNSGDAWNLIDRVMSEMQRAAKRGHDRSFAEFLKKSKQPDHAKRLAAEYVEGFNAARKEVIGIASLAQDERAAEAIDGDRMFRNARGYDSIVQALARQTGDLRARLRLNSIVERIEWRKGSATVYFRSGLDAHIEALRCRCVVVTVPLGVLQADEGAPGAIRFDPQPEQTLAAARRLRFGHVVRVVLQFREAFWERNQKLADVGFLLSEQPLFPTWWTALPMRVPVLTAWSAGPHSDALLGETREKVIDCAIEDLAHIVNVESSRLRTLLEAADFHDWHADPFSRGAYSYAPAGAVQARRKLAEPVDDTLYFAGEATETNGHSATVHGAIASGKAAARQILSGVRFR